MNNLNKLPYAEWLEQSLRNIVGKPVQAICIMTKFEDSEVGTGYWNVDVADKILFSGFLQQDAMLDTMRANGYIDDEDGDDEEEDEYDGEED